MTDKAAWPWMLTEMTAEGRAKILADVLCELLDAMDEVDEGAEHYKATKSTERVMPAVARLDMARKIGRRHAPRRGGA